MNPRIFLPLLALLILVAPSCKKDPPPSPPPVLYPKAYLPAYPGSWWKYATDTGDTLDWTTSGDYQTHHFTQADFSESVSVRVPYLNGMPVYEYDKIANAPLTGGAAYAKRWPVLREETGVKFEREFYDAQTPTNQRENVTVLGKIPQLMLNGTSYDTVLVQRGFAWATYDMQLKPVYTCEYFARNIGLVWKTKVDTVSGDTLLNQKLINYHIAN